MFHLLLLFLIGYPLTGGFKRVDRIANTSVCRFLNLCFWNSKIVDALPCRAASSCAWPALDLYSPLTNHDGIPPILICSFYGDTGYISGYIIHNWMVCAHIYHIYRRIVRIFIVPCRFPIGPHNSGYTLSNVPFRWYFVNILFINGFPKPFLLVILDNIYVYFICLPHIVPFPASLN